MGTAMAVCFGYWLGVSSLLFFIAYLFNAQLGIVQIFSITVSSLQLDKLWCKHYNNLIAWQLNHKRLGCVAGKHNMPCCTALHAIYVV